MTPSTLKEALARCPENNPLSWSAEDCRILREGAEKQLIFEISEYKLEIDLERLLRATKDFENGAAEIIKNAKPPIATILFCTKCNEQKGFQDKYCEATA